MSGAARTKLVMFFALLATTACRREEKKQARPVVTSELPPLAPPASPAPTLAVPGYSEAVTVVPSGITTPAPVVVAVLGIGDTPESQCAVWRELVGQRAFVLCPRGKPHFVRERVEGDTSEPDTEGEEPAEDAGKVVQSGFYHPQLEVLEREVEAGLGALRAQYGAYVAAGPALYAGFSRGAFLGASLVAKHPATFSRAVLIEGGQSAWNDETAATFAENGGKRVLFACGQPSCVAEAERAAALLAKRNVQTRIVHGQGEGHGYKRQVKEQVKESLDWATDGDPLWRQLFAAAR
jgi:predicted esterase